MSAVTPSRELSQLMFLGGGVLRLPSLPHRLSCPIFWGLATLTKLNTEMRICCTKFGIVTLIYETSILVEVHFSTKTTRHVM